MDVRDQLQKTLGDAYTLERELGGGGMSRVFVATEASLGRRVVVKVLPGASGGAVSIERFKREIQLAARLQHPHIVPLLTAGESEGLPFFTMPFVEGESLRVRLARGGELPVAEGVRILREVAGALATAHEKGIVHRDIKPDNVLLSRGAAMVTDFGVAKALSESTDIDHATMTSLGVALGTPAYMAPEQAAASPNIDARVDIYAWGIMAYELFAGRPPFSGRPPQAILAAHVSETPEHVLKLRPTLPPALTALIMRCLEKRAADRPQSAAEIIHTLDAITTPSGGSEPTSALRSVSTASGSPPTLGASRSRVRMVVAAIVVFAVGVWAVGQLRSPGTTAAQGLRTVAVLPLVNSDTSSDYLALGVADDIRIRLVATGLNVTSSSSSRRYSGREVDVRTVGESLKVAYVVQGEMRTSAEGIRLNVELVRTADGFSAWAESFVIGKQELPALPDSIARAVSEALGVTATGAARGNVAAGTRNADAYDFYLGAKHLFEQRGEASLLSAIALFDKAIGLDSNFARAHAGRAVALGALAVNWGTLRADSLMRLAREGADRAIAFDSTLAEAYAARGTLLGFYGSPRKWNDAVRDLRHAVRIDSQYGSAHKWLGQVLAATGNFVAAESALTRAAELDPALASVWDALGVYYLAARQDSAALVALNRARELYDPSLRLDLAYFIARVHASAGRPQEALAALAKLADSDSPWALAHRAYILAKVGLVPEARVIAERLTARARTAERHTAQATAHAHLGMGDVDKGIEWLITAAKREELMRLVERDFDPIRTHRRYPELLRLLGLDDQPIAQWKGGPPVVVR
jgi:serine/threonine-protein kinase